MKFILHIIETFLVLLGIATVLVIISLGIPDWSPFQPTLGTTVIPIAMMVSAWIMLLVAYAAFRTIKVGSDREIRDRKERLLNEIINWAEDIHNNLFSKRVDTMFPRYEERTAGKGYKDLPSQDVLNMDSLDQDVLEVGAIGRLIRDGNFMEVTAGGIDDELVSLIHAAIEQMNLRRQLIPEGARFRKNIPPSAEELQKDIEKWASLTKLIEDKAASLNGISEEDQIHVKMGRNAGELKESADEIVKKAIELKLST